MNLDLLPELKSVYLLGWQNFGVAEVTSRFPASISFLARVSVALPTCMGCVLSFATFGDCCDFPGGLMTPNPPVTRKPSGRGPGMSRVWRLDREGSKRQWVSHSRLPYGVPATKGTSLPVMGAARSLPYLTSKRANHLKVSLI